MGDDVCLDAAAVVEAVGSVMESDAADTEAETDGEGDDGADGSEGDAALGACCCCNGRDEDNVKDTCCCFCSADKSSGFCGFNSSSFTVCIAVGPTLSGSLVAVIVLIVAALMVDWGVSVNEFVVVVVVLAFACLNYSYDTSAR